MSLAAAIDKHNKAKGFNAILLQLDTEGREDLIEALANPSIGPTAISRGLREYGVEVDERSVRRWREKRGVSPVDLEETA